jgi:hypothetical protein
MLCEYPGCIRPESPVGRLGLCGYHSTQSRRGEVLRPLGINKLNGKWAVRVNHLGTNHRGGDYDDLDDAIQAQNHLKRRLGIAP